MAWGAHVLDWAKELAQIHSCSDYRAGPIGTFPCPTVKHAAHSARCSTLIRGAYPLLLGSWNCSTKITAGNSFSSYSGVILAESKEHNSHSLTLTLSLFSVSVSDFGIGASADQGPPSPPVVGIRVAPEVWEVPPAAPEVWEVPLLPWRFQY
ncbi:hypothetical protein TSUD_257380 [Trifolium subterraneum]|uniref:Uncharacterized protein n=1 Tax=Trifolium subterraneum TaxID=3900 RepID=A0A2Z6N9N7_TRISU|nr:hypothetical protein TSUD_257380 [Trifolium subterraneum]